MKSILPKSLQSTKYLACSLALLLNGFTAYAKDPIIGTPNADPLFDSDGDPVGNLTEFNLDVIGVQENGTTQTNRFKTDSSNTSTQWWVNADSTAPWKYYAPDSTSNQNIAAHFLNPVGVGESFYVGLSFERGMQQYTSLFREVNGIIPDGTNVYFGISDNGVKPGLELADIDSRKTKNLALQGTDSPILSPFDVDAYDWFHYELDGSFGSGHEFVLKPDTEFVSTWVAYYVLPAGESLAAGTDWARSGYDRNGNEINVTPGDTYYGPDGNAGPAFRDDPTQDVVFNWTVDSKSDTYTDVPNPNYGIVVIPEPSSASLALMVFSALLFRRRRV